MHALLYFYILDLERRPLDIEEKKYLLDIEAVNETQCNMGKRERERERVQNRNTVVQEKTLFFDTIGYPLGLVAVETDGVLELMAEEFPDKYKVR